MIMNKNGDKQDEYQWERVTKTARFMESDSHQLSFCTVHADVIQSRTRTRQNEM